MLFSVRQHMPFACVSFACPSFGPGHIQQSVACKVSVKVSAKKWFGDRLFVLYMLVMMVIMAGDVEHPRMSGRGLVDCTECWNTIE